MRIKLIETGILAVILSEESKDFDRIDQVEVSCVDGKIVIVATPDDFDSVLRLHLGPEDAVNLANTILNIAEKDER